MTRADRKPAPGPDDGVLADGLHRFAARIYYADTDLSGAVYHARYLELLERGRSDYLRCLGLRHDALRRRDPPVFWVVRRMQIDFVAAAGIEDIVSVGTRVVVVGGAHIDLQQRIDRDDRTLLTASVKAALVDASGRPRRLERDWIAMFRQQRDAAGPDAREAFTQS